MKQKKAVLFDMDGLLADTEEIHVKSYLRVAEKLGINLPRAYIHSFIGVSTRDNIKRIVEDFKIPMDYMDVLSIRYKYYIDELKNSEIYPMDGAIETIGVAKKYGARTALVTSSLKEHALLVLEKILKNVSNSTVNTRDNGEYTYEHIFDIMVFGDEVSNPKPDPEIYIKASKRLNIKPANCIVLEDSSAGIIAAKRANMTAIAVPNHHTKDQNFESADYIFGSLSELLKSKLLEHLLSQPL